MRRLPSISSLSAPGSGEGLGRLEVGGPAVDEDGIRYELCEQIGEGCR
ncbi:hypothetical protein YT1_2017 [Rhodococcus ruber]|nr:hypothetical protein YT1_2017 [Rhodococcus ruber]